MFIGLVKDQVFDSERLLWVSLEGVLPLLGCPDKVPGFTLDDNNPIDQDHLHDGIYG
jgi:hypothetical protein